MERGKKIYTFIILKIEVPPVIVKSTVEWKAGELKRGLNSVSTSIKRPFHFPRFKWISSPTRRCLRTWIWRNASGEVLRRRRSLRRRCDCSHSFIQLETYAPEGRQWPGGRMRNKQYNSPALAHTHPAIVSPPTNPKVPAHTRRQAQGLFFVYLSLYINQPSILHKNMEELLLPRYTPFTMVVVHSNKRKWKKKSMENKQTKKKKN